MFFAEVQPRRLRAVVTIFAGLFAAACASDEAKENPWHDLEAIKLAAVYRFVKLETDERREIAYPLGTILRREKTGSEGGPRGPPGTGDGE